jgi:hypothetical protein
MDTLTVSQRKTLFENSFSRPKDRLDAYIRARDALFYQGGATVITLENLCDDIEFSGKTEYDFWTDVVIEYESRKQGNLVCLLLYKYNHQKRLAEQEKINNLLKEIKTYFSYQADIDYYLIETYSQSATNPVEYLQNTLNLLKDQDQDQDYNAFVDVPLDF